MSSRFLFIFWSGFPFSPRILERFPVFSLYSGAFSRFLSWDGDYLLTGHSKERWTFFKIVIVKTELVIAATVVLMIVIIVIILIFTVFFLLLLKITVKH